MNLVEKDINQSEFPLENLSRAMRSFEIPHVLRFIASADKY